jgi:hypothetical protein
MGARQQPTASSRQFEKLKLALFKKEEKGE